ncbi:hypothetical protein [Streptomyces sp. NPDC056244]|uniref:hypothetical protein n=1 Tax=Streptomyces sp. NPDC056244 TaxID=3345762 RepID=UPI0035DFEC2F
MTHSGQGDEQRHPAARPAHEGVVLPGDGSAPWIPGQSAEEPAPAQGPAGGQPWGQPWGPGDGQQDQPGYGGGAQPGYGGGRPEGGQPQYGGQHGGQQGYGQQPGGQSYGPQEGAPYGGQLPPSQPLPPAQGPGQAYPQQEQPYQQQGQPYHQPQPPQHAQPLPPQAPAAGSADATQYLPPVSAAPGIPGAGDADATQFIAPIAAGPGPGMLPPESAAEATQFLPSPIQGQGPGQGGQGLGQGPGQGGPDADATQYIAPVPAQQGPGQNVPAAPPGAPYGIRPGAPGERQPPAEFDSLFRSDAPPGGGQGADSTQPLPQFGVGRGPQQVGQRPAAAPYEPPQHASYDQGQGQGRAQEPRQPQGRSAGRRKSSPVPVIAAVVIGCAVLGLGAGALMSGGGDDTTPDNSAAAGAVSSAPAEPSPSEAADDPAKPQAEALDKLLADSGSSRATVIKAVESIKSCDNLDQAATDLHGAAEQRRDLVTRLKDLTLDKLPDNGELTSSLTEAWEASASADDHYANWAKQVKGKKNCKDGQARVTQQAAEGNRASGDATAAKQKASKLWNGIATKYGLSQRPPTQL